MGHCTGCYGNERVLQWFQLLFQCKGISWFTITPFYFWAAWTWLFNNIVNCCQKSVSVQPIIGWKQENKSALYEITSLAHFCTLQPKKREKKEALIGVWNEFYSSSQNSSLSPFFLGKKKKIKVLLFTETWKGVKIWNGRIGLFSFHFWFKMLRKENNDLVAAMNTLTFK